MSSCYTESKPHTDGTLPSFSGNPWSSNSELGDYVKPTLSGRGEISVVNHQPGNPDVWNLRHSYEAGMGRNDLYRKTGPGSLTFSPDSTSQDGTNEPKEPFREITEPFYIDPGGKLTLITKGTVKYSGNVRQEYEQAQSDEAERLRTLERTKGAMGKIRGIFGRT